MKEKAEKRVARDSRTGQVQVRNMSGKAMEAAKAFKGAKASDASPRPKGKNAAAIKRAVRSYYLG